VAQLLKTLELDDCFYLAYVFLGAVYSQLGKHKEALAALEEAHRQGGEGTRVLGWLALVNAQLGREKKVLTIVQELEERSQSRYVCPLDLARAYLGLRDTDLNLPRGSRRTALRTIDLGGR